MDLRKGLQELDEIRREEGRIEAVSVAQLAVSLVGQRVHEPAHGRRPDRATCKRGGLRPFQRPACVEKHVWNSMHVWNSWDREKNLPLGLKVDGWNLPTRHATHLLPVTATPQARSVRSCGCSSEPVLTPWILSTDGGSSDVCGRRWGHPVGLLSVAISVIHPCMGADGPHERTPHDLPPCTDQCKQFRSRIKI